MRFSAILTVTSVALLLLAACPKAEQSEASGAQVSAEKGQRTERFAPLGAEFHWLTTADSHSIASWYYPPSEREGAAPALILVHQRGSEKSSWKQVASKLVAEGYAVTALDLRGHGESVDARGRQPSLRSLKDEDYTLMLHDIRAAHTFLKDQPETDADRVAVIGASIGANLGIMYASIDRRVRTVVALSPGLDYFGLKPAEHLEKFGTRALYLLAAKGDEDSYESCQQLEKLATLANPVSFRELASNAHGTELFTEHPGLDDTVISGWLFNHLPPR